MDDVIRALVGRKVRVVFVHPLKWGTNPAQLQHDDDVVNVVSCEGTLAALTSEGALIDESGRKTFVPTHNIGVIAVTPEAN